MEDWIMKYEQRKQEKNLYGVKQTPIIVEVPKQKFILLKGKGNPNEVDFSDRISALYSLAYAIKMLFKNAMKNKTDNEITDFTVYPLEGLWEKVNGAELDKNKLEYTLMIKQPDFITQEIFTKSLENIKKKKPNALYDEINGEIIEDDEGNLYAEIEIPNDYNLFNYIFSFGDGAEVLEPKEIRMQIKEMINKMAEKYIT